jgi:ABC-type multidrug transport system ATPase subunit
MNKVIDVIGLSKSFGANKAVDGLNLSVYEGDVFGFLGPNGAGKSTTIRMILSLISPDNGQIKIFGKNLLEDRISILNRIGCIIEKPDFYKYLTARKNLKLLAHYNGVDASDKKIDEVIELVGLQGRSDESVKGYSHGMKQRLGIAQALIHDPDLIILDEPTTGLDPQGIIDIRNLILYLSKEKGKTVFLSSHILYEIELVANRMAILNKGKLVVQGEVKSLLNSEDSIVEIQLDRLPDAKDKLKEKFNIDSLILDRTSSLQCKMDANNIPMIISFLVENGFQIHQVTTRRHLEDLFLKLTSKETVASY